MIPVNPHSGTGRVQDMPALHLLISRTALRTRGNQQHRANQRQTPMTQTAAELMWRTSTWAQTDARSPCLALPYPQDCTQASETWLMQIGGTCQRKGNWPTMRTTQIQTYPPPCSPGRQQDVKHGS
eukprot:1618304-Heterocapsa_arctica.AAC.1